jgi:hypothetical protein
MKKLVLLFGLFFVVFESVNACTVNIVPLRKEYQQSKNVFLGEIISNGL